MLKSKRIFLCMSIILIAGLTGCDDNGLSRSFGTPYNRIGPKHPYRAATALAISPDGNLLAAAYINNAEVWNIKSGKSLGKFSALKDGSIMDVHFLNNETLLTAGKDKALRFWNVKTGKQTKSIICQDCWFMPMAILSDGKTAISLETGNRICIWNLGTGKLTRTFPGQADGVQDIALLPKGKTLVTSSNSDNAVVLWDIATGKKLGTIPAETFGLAVSPDGKRLAFRKDNATVVWNLETNKLEQNLRPREYGIGHFSFAFSPDGTKLAAAELGGDVLIWDLKTGNELADYDNPAGDGLAVIFSKDGKYVFSGGHRDATVRQWPVPKVPAENPAKN